MPTTWGRRSGMTGNSIMVISVFLLLAMIQNIKGLKIKYTDPIELTAGNSFLGPLPLEYMGKEHVVSFELFIEKFTGADWSNILHLTTGGNGGPVGSRIPLVGVAKDHNLHVTSAISGNANQGGNLYMLVPDKWIKVEISQFLNLNDQKYYWRVDVDGENKKMLENNSPEKFNNVKVYTADGWHVLQPAKIRDLLIWTRDDSQSEVYTCHRFTPEQNEKITVDNKTQQEVCEALGYGYKFTKGDNTKAPGCNGCWCCRPDL